MYKSSKHALYFYIGTINFDQIWPLFPGTVCSRGKTKPTFSGGLKQALSQCEILWGRLIITEATEGWTLQFFSTSIFQPTLTVECYLRHVQKIKIRISSRFPRKILRYCNEILYWDTAEILYMVSTQSFIKIRDGEVGGCRRHDIEWPFRWRFKMFKWSNKHMSDLANQTELIFYFRFNI